MKTFRQFYEQLSQIGTSNLTSSNDPTTQQARRTQSRAIDAQLQLLRKQKRNLTTASTMREEISPALERLIARREALRQRTQERLEANREKQRQAEEERERKKQEAEREQEIIQKIASSR